MKTTKTFDALIAALKNYKLESNSQMTYMFSILNGDKQELKDLIQPFFVDPGAVPFTLSDDQVEKGYKWLLNQWKTPTGNDRKNNPFGFREQDILERFDRIELYSYYDASRYGMRPYLIPLYQVISKDGDGFEYYVFGGEVHITG